MLFFITITQSSARQSRIFKYISCYSLSKYHNHEIKKVYAFKYISCYSLSYTYVPGNELLRIFKYISCYSLSPAGTAPEEVARIQIHLMLFFIIDWIAIQFPKIHSNTSHVILYRAAAASSTAVSAIQIHLMLFFIVLQPLPLQLSPPFKYISCYSLSVYSAM